MLILPTECIGMAAICSNIKRHASVTCTDLISYIFTEGTTHRRPRCTVWSRGRTRGGGKAPGDRGGKRTARCCPPSSAGETNGWPSPVSRDQSRSNTWLPQSRRLPRTFIKTQSILPNTFRNESNWSSGMMKFDKDQGQLSNWASWKCYSFETPATEK